MPTGRPRPRRFKSSCELLGAERTGRRGEPRVWRVALRAPGGARRATVRYVRTTRQLSLPSCTREVLNAEQSKAHRSRTANGSAGRENGGAVQDFASRDDGEVEPSTNPVDCSRKNDAPVQRRNRIKRELHGSGITGDRVSALAGNILHLGKVPPHRRAPRNRPQSRGARRKPHTTSVVGCESHRPAKRLHHHVSWSVARASRASDDIAVRECTSGKDATP